MNLSRAMLFVACLASAEAGDSTALRSPMRAKLSDELKGRYHHAATPGPAEAATPVDASVVRMAPVVVVGDARFRELDAGLKEQLQAMKAGESWSESPITLFRGKGLLPEVEIKVTPHDRDDGFDFLRVGISW